MIFETEDNVVSWVKHNYSEKELQRLKVSSTALTDAPWALVAYKGILSEKINTLLRENPNAIETNEKLSELQKLIFEYSIPTDITVYRYVSYKEYSWLNRMTRWRKICTYNGFLSTTLLAKRYREFHSEVFGRVIIEIKVPKGAIGTYLPEVNPNMPEFEILFSHGTRLKRIGMGKYTIVTK